MLFLGIILFLLVTKGAGISIDEVIVSASADDDIKDSVDDNPWYDYGVAGQKGTFVKLQLDMIVSRTTWQSMDSITDVQGVPTRHKRKAVKDERRLWPGSIPYRIDDLFSAEDILAITEAMQDWSLYTCVKFRPAVNTDFNIIYFKHTDIPECSSFVGMLVGTQPILLAKACRVKRVIVHEIGHALGLYHEHMRVVRDDYVIIHPDNIGENDRHNFDKLSPRNSQHYSVPYDYESVMHYGKLFFSKDKGAGLVTIEPKNSSYLDTIGEAETVSFRDIQIVNAMYRCNADCIKKPCLEGAFLGEGCECWCPGQAGGPAVLCDSPGQCGPPEVDTAIYNVYTPEWKQVDVNRDKKYPHGTWLKVDFSDTGCGDGFVELVCANGFWSDTLPECRLDCILPSREYYGGPEFSYNLGNETLKEGEILPDNTTVSVTCTIPTPKDYDHYTAEDDDGGTQTPIMCLNGTWIGEFPQNCTAGCSHDIANGHVINGSYLFGYHISCDRGYEFTLQGTVTGTFNCYDGVWGAPKPDCQPKSCRIPGYTYGLGVLVILKDRETVRLSENREIRHNDTVTQLCPAGHFPSDRVVRCDLGTWTTAGWTSQGGTEESMDIEEDKEIGSYDEGAVADGMEIEMEDTKLGNVSFSELSGGGVIEDDSGIVDTNHTDGMPGPGDFPVCREVTCPTTPPVTRVSYYPEKQKYMYGDKVIVNKCQGTLEFIGQHEIRCQGNGTWSGAATCWKFCQGGKIEQIQLQNTWIRAKGDTFNIASFGRCKNKCRRYKKFVCRAITFGLDFRRGWKCILHTQDPDSNPRLLGVKPKWTVVYRHCTEQS